MRVVWKFFKVDEGEVLFHCSRCHDELKLGDEYLHVGWNEHMTLCPICAKELADQIDKWHGAGG